jgi:hypothetical protein
MSTPATSRLLKLPRRRLVEGITPGEPNLDTSGSTQNQTEAAPASRLVRRSMSARETMIAQRGGSAVCYGPETLPMPSATFGTTNATYRLTSSRGWGRPNRLLRVPRQLLVTADNTFAGAQMDRGRRSATTLASARGRARRRGRGRDRVGPRRLPRRRLRARLGDGRRGGRAWRAWTRRSTLGGELLVDRPRAPARAGFQGPTSGAPTAAGRRSTTRALYDHPHRRTRDGGPVDVAFPAPFCADLQDKWAAVVARTNKAKVKILHAHGPRVRRGAGDDDGVADRGPRQRPVRGVADGRVQPRSLPVQPGRADRGGVGRGGWPSSPDLSAWPSSAGCAAAWTRPRFGRAIPAVTT